MACCVNKVILTGFLLILFLFTMYSQGAAFYCGSELVSNGDTKAEVLRKCGEPFWKEQHEVILVEGKSSDKESRVSVIIDEWSYNFSESSWVYRLRFSNGKLEDIETRGYGYPKRGAVDPCGDGRNISLGDITAEVVLKCGEPFHKEYREDEIRQKVERNIERRISIIIEEWTYDFRPKGWMYLLRFENGKLVNIETR